MNRYRRRFLGFLFVFFYIYTHKWGGGGEEEESIWAFHLHSNA